MNGSNIHLLKATLAFTIALAMLGCLIAAAVFVHTSYLRASATDPNPNGEAYSEKSAFPIVDWSYWQSVNPSVIAWLTVPGTNIDMPVVQASENDDTYYLSHDISGNPNYMGCAYLDESCAKNGLDSQVAYIFGHNIHYMDAMFSPFANYTDSEFLDTHRTILLQTPEKKLIYTVKGASVVPGSEKTKRTDFGEFEDFRDWWNSRLAECSTCIPGCEITEQANDMRFAIFVTCSYEKWEDDERTLVYTSCIEA